LQLINSGASLKPDPNGGSLRREITKVLTFRATLRGRLATNDATFDFRIE